LAKNAEERYQSAWGIKADLEQCQTQLRNNGSIESFPLANIIEQFSNTAKVVWT